MWILVIYLLMSLVVMAHVKPWEDPLYEPILMTFLCLILGGALLIAAVLVVVVVEIFTGKDFPGE